MEVQQNDIANVQGRSLAFSSDVGTAYAQTGNRRDKYVYVRIFGIY